MNQGNEVDENTLLPPASGVNLESQAAPKTESKKVDDTLAGSWFGLLSSYNHLLAQSPIRRENVVSIEEYARQNGLWLLLDSVPSDVVAAEIQVRQSAGEALRRSDYASRFPHLARQLDSLPFQSTVANEGQITKDQGTEDTASTILKDKENDHESGASASLSLGSQFGQYQIDKEIGQGGMGAVYLATHVKLGKQVALKILPKAFTKDRDRVLRFEREMRSLGRVDHPNIVRAFDAGEIEGVQYLAMEFVEGIDLQKMVKKLGPCTPELACKLIAQTTAGLQVAHAAGLVHRDIKPSNILVTRDGMVKIVDLGLARIQTTDTDVDATNQLTLQQQMMGTPDYMAPEQWANAAEADGRADLYALGCTLYFLLSGNPPYGSKDTKSVSRKMKAHLYAPPPRLQDVCQDLPDGLVQLYERLMAKDPDRRPQSAFEVNEALNKIYPQSDVQNSIVPLVDLKQISQCLATESSAKALVTNRWNRPWVIAGCGLGLIIALGSIFALSNRPKPMSIPDRSISVQSPTASIGVEVIQKRSETDLQRRGIIGQQIDSAKLGDLVKLSVHFSEPSYCYVVALNPTNDPDWKSQLLYPANSEVKPELKDTITLPAKGTSFIPLTDGSGQQVYVVIESSKPLPSFQEWQSKHDWSSEWKQCQRAGVWQFINGDLSLRPLPDQERAAIVDIAPPELSGVLERLNASLGNDQQKITAVAFPVQAPFSR